MQDKDPNPNSWQDKEAKRKINAEHKTKSDQEAHERQRAENIKKYLQKIDEENQQRIEQRNERIEQAREDLDIQR